MRVLFLLLLWFAILAGLDVALTMHILAHGGAELNPLALPFLRHGYLGLVAQKTLALCLIGALMHAGLNHAARINAQRATAATYAAALTPFAAFPFAWNLGVIA